MITPLALFLSFYLATLFIGVFLGVPWLQWVALISVSIATVATVGLWDRWQWRLGVFAPPRRVVTETFFGLAFGIVLVGGADLLIVASTTLRHGHGSGLPWGELLAVFIPAVLHEELLFRGYPFQRLRFRHRAFAIISVSAAFATLHLWNEDVTAIAIGNIFLGGVLLSLAYERYERLWFPIGLHLMWNVMSGPILGHDVSGYAPAGSFLTVIGSAPALLTGGAFGIEGSLWMTVVEGGAILLMWRTNEGRGSR